MACIGNGLKAAWNGIGSFITSAKTNQIAINTSSAAAVGFAAFSLLRKLPMNNRWNKIALGAFLFSRIFVSVAKHRKLPFAINGLGLVYATRVQQQQPKPQQPPQPPELQQQQQSNSAAAKDGKPPLSSAGSSEDDSGAADVAAAAAAAAAAASSAAAGSSSSSSSSSVASDGKEHRNA